MSKVLFSLSLFNSSNFLFANSKKALKFSYGHPVPITPGIIKLLERYNINLDGASVTIVGRGNIVGKPLSIAMTNRNATVTMCHSHSEPLENYTKDADIIVAACGCGRLIKKDMVKEGFVGVDVGVSFIDGKQVGDFDESAYDKASYITMPTGGVGPMTISMIINNLINLKKNSDN